MVERRMFERFSPITEIYYSTKASGQKNKAIGLRDISGGGASLLLSERLPKGTRINLEILLSNEAEPVLLDGIINWVKEDRNGQCCVGIIFISPDLFSLGRLFER